MKHIKCEGGGNIPIPESYADCIKLIISDYFRISGRIDSIFKIFKASIYNSSVWILILFRLNQHHGCFSPILVRLYLSACKKYHIFLPPSTKVGYGFYIGHGFGLVINGTAIIGNNVNLSQFTTIGSNRDKAAQIGDNVYIGPSVCVVENVHIGNCADVGAGAVVVKDVPDNAVVVGVPARVVKYNCKTTNKHPYPYILSE